MCCLNYVVLFKTTLSIYYKNFNQNYMQYFQENHLSEFHFHVKDYFYIK